MAGFTTGTATVSNNPASRRKKGFARKFTTRLIPARSERELFSLTWDRASRRFFPPTSRFLRQAGHVLVTKIFHECNYFQANEGNLDPSHVSYLHRQANVPENLKRTVQGSDGKLPLALYEADIAPQIEAEETDYGVRIFSIRTYR